MAIQKAKIKETGEIVEVVVYDNEYDHYNDKLIIYYKDKRGRCYAEHQLDFDNTELPPAPDSYWDRLFHQYVGMIMAGYIANPNHTPHDKEKKAIWHAKELIKKLMEEKL